MRVFCAFFLYRIETRTNTTLHIIVFCHSKGKKDGKQDTKPDKELEMEKAKANAAVWELRLQVTDESLAQYRDSCRKLARVNEELTNELHRAEKDAIDITGFFRRQDTAKEEKVGKWYQFVYVWEN